MATGDYCGINELKQRLWPDNTEPDGENDNELARVITAVSRMIDQFTGTRFYTTATDETRYYTAHRSDECRIDQAISITSVATDDNADRTYSQAWVLTTDYELLPDNATLLGYPYYAIVRAPLSGLAFPSTRKAVKVIGKFGYDSSVSPTTTFAPIREACILQSLKAFKATPFGVAGPTPEGLVGVIPGLHPDVMAILKLYKVNQL